MILKLITHHSSLMKRIYWQTNFNNKLSCKAFIHIDKAPEGNVPVSSWGCEVTICTKDNSHPPVIATLHSMLGGTLETICYDNFTFASHGMDRDSFKQWWLANHPEYEEGKRIAVYYYMNSYAQ